MRIPDSKIAEITNAADIVEVISDYVDLKKAGKDYRGLCPFHGDNDPSFYVSPQKEIFYCFGCATGGSVFSFLMKMENLTFVEAVRKVSQRYGVPFEIEHGRSESRGDRERLLEILGFANRCFKSALEPNADAAAYLEGRGVPPEWIERLELGFAPDSWDTLVRAIRRERLDLRDALNAGLVKARSGGGYYDLFRSRITIPIYDLNNSITAFGGRIVGEGEPKYLNSPDTSVFHKKRLLYGLHGARDAIRSEGSVILVEGYFDQIALRIRGLEHVVAPLGTALGRDQIKLLKRFTSNVVTVFDGDEAGVRAVKRAIPMFLAEGLEPRCLILHEDKDPDEAIRRVGADGFRTLLDDAVPMIDFLLESLADQYDLSTLQGRNSAIEECLPVMMEIADRQAGDYLIERISSRTRVREEHLRRLVRAKSRGGKRERDQRPSRKRNIFEFPADEAHVVRGMLLFDGFVDEVVESGALKEIVEPVLKEMAELMVWYVRETGDFDAVSFCRAITDDGLASTAAGWLQPCREEDDLRDDPRNGIEGRKAASDALKRLKLRKYRRRLEEIKQRMSACREIGDEYNKLAEELLEINRRLKSARSDRGA